MLNKENINLTKEMELLVDKYVQHYKTDFQYDKELILDENYNSNTFYWMLRKSGTHLMNNNTILIKNDYSNTLALYYNKDKKEIVKIYKIDIEKRGKKYAYGNITEIEKNNFTKFIKDNTKIPKGIQRNIFYANKDNKVENKTIDIYYTDDFREKYNNNEINYILDILKINKEQIEKTYTNKYYL